MQKTSFGEMDHILKLDDKVIAEYLVFEKDGRKHQHPEYESFVVLSGEGQVFSGEQTFNVKPGDIVTIPPKTFHWMKPKADQLLTGMLWYHTEPTNLKSSVN